MYEEIYNKEINETKKTNETKLSDNTEQINKEMAVRLLWLNIFFGIIFVAIAYYILSEKNYILPSKNKAPFYTTIGFTLFFLAYHYYAEKSAILGINDKEKELEELQAMMKSDKTIIETFPLILFALGILLRDVPCGSCVKVLKYNYKLIMNLFLLATLFGVLLPFLIDTLIIDYTSLQRLLLFENLEFISISYGFGFILTILSVVYVNNK